MWDAYLIFTGGSTTTFASGILETALLVAAGVAVSEWFRSKRCSCIVAEFDEDAEEEGGSIFHSLLVARDFGELLNFQKENEGVRMKGGRRFKDFFVRNSKRAAQVMMK